MPNGLAGSAQVSYPLQAPNGTVGAPSYSFAGYPDNGWYMAASNSPALSVQGISVLRAAWNFLWIPSDTIPLLLGAAQDVGLYRDAADILAQRRGVNAQSFRVYETYTDAGNYRMLNIGGNGLTLQSAGTGVSAGSLYLWNSQAGALEMATSNTRRWIVEATGSLVPYVDNTYNIGSLTNRPTFVFCVYSYVSGACTAGQFLFPGMGGFWPGADGVIVMKDTAATSFGRLCWGGATASEPAIKRDGANLALVPADGSAGYIDLTVHDLISNSVYLSNIVSVGANNTNISLGGSGITAGLVNSAASFIIQVTGGAVLATFAGTGYLEMTEVTAPSAPAANSGRLYFEDNGAGKTRLMCLFGSGAAQQLAIEP